MIEKAKTWTILSRHRDEEPLNSAFATSSWPITTCSRPYRYFRILQTGRNSSNHNFLSLSGIEFYGELYETAPLSSNSFGNAPPAASQSPPLQTPPMTPETSKNT